VLPYGVLVPLALAIGALAPGLAAGALVLAIAPAELAAPALARLLGGRMENAAAVVTGTLVVSFALLLTMFGAAASAATTNTALFAFVAGAAVAGAVPLLRDAVLPLIRAASALALAILVVAALVEGAPALRPETAIAALALLGVGSLAAAIVAAVFGGEPRAIMLGGGTRDFAVAATLAVRAGGDAAAAVPLAYGALLFAALAVVFFWRRMRATPRVHSARS
jgi:hypothetical protein